MAEKDEGQTQQPTAEETAKATQEAEAGFAAVFDGTAEGQSAANASTTSEKSDADKQADADAKAKTEADAKAKTESDAKAASEAEWNALPKVVRERFDALDGLPGQMRTLAGHIGGLNSKLDTALATAKAAATSKGADAPTDKQVQAALSNPEGWKKLKEDFPEWAGPVEAELTAMRGEIAKNKGIDVEVLKKDLSGTFGKTLDDRVNQAEQRAEERAVLRIKHPDWKTVVNTPEFHAWSLEGGPSPEMYQRFKALQRSEPVKANEMQEGFARSYPKWWDDRGASMFSDSADAASKMLDGYKTHRTSAAQAEEVRLKKEKRLAGAVAPKGTGTAQPIKPTEKQAEEEGFNSVFDKK